MNEEKKHPFLQAVIDVVTFIPSLILVGMARLVLGEKQYSNVISESNQQTINDAKNKIAEDIEEAKEKKQQEQNKEEKQKQQTQQTQQAQTDKIKKKEPKKTEKSEQPKETKKQYRDNDDIKVTKIPTKNYDKNILKTVGMITQDAKKQEGLYWFLMESKSTYKQDTLSFDEEKVRDYMSAYETNYGLTKDEMLRGIGNLAANEYLSDGLTIDTVGCLSFEDLAQMIICQVDLIETCSCMPVVTQEILVDKDCRFAKFIDKRDIIEEKVAIKAVREDFNIITALRNPTDNVIKAALIASDLAVLPYIKNVSKDVMNTCVDILEAKPNSNIRGYIEATRPELLSLANEVLTERTKDSQEKTHVEPFVEKNEEEIYEGFSFGVEEDELENMPTDEEFRRAFEEDYERIEAECIDEYEQTTDFSKEEAVLTPIDRAYENYEDNREYFFDLEQDEMTTRARNDFREETEEVTPEIDPETCDFDELHLQQCYENDYDDSVISYEPDEYDR